MIMAINFHFQTGFLVLLCFSSAVGLYFHIGETEKKCFIEEVLDETMVIGDYKTQLYDKNTNDVMPSSPQIGMHVEVEVRDPDNKIILSKVYSSEGRFTFTSHTPGEHSICLYFNSTNWELFGANNKMRVHLDIEVGEHANDYKQIAEKDKLTELQLRVRQLLDQVEQVQKEQNYRRYREGGFRQTSWNTNQRILWWSLGQTVILLITGFWQMRHLKGYFEATNSEDSGSTSPSAESDLGSLSSLSDCEPTAELTTTTPGAGEALALDNGGDMVVESDGSDMVVESDGSEEDTLLRVSRRKEWLSLRVPGSPKWRLLPFGCLGGNLDS